MITAEGRKILTPFALAIFMITCSTNIIAEEPFTMTQVDQNGSSSCRRSHNAGVHADGRTFICWAGPKMAPCVKMYDHKGGTWSKTVVVNSYSSSDYHDYPVIVRGTDGFLHVFWTKHNGDIHHARSPRPFEVEGVWSHEVIKGVRATYPCPMVGQKGDIYLFYRGRGNSTRSHADYIHSTDGGKTWEQVHDAISTRFAGGLRGFYFMHTAYEPGRGDTLGRYQMVWNLRTSPSSPLVNVCFVRFDPNKARFESVDGTDLGKSISEEEANASCLVKTTKNATWGLLSHNLGNGQPVVLYNMKANKVTTHRCARWTGASWEDSVVPFNFEEIELLEANRLRVYSPGPSRFSWWDTVDNGKTWQQAGGMELPVKGISQAILIDNFHPDAKLFIKQDDQWNPKNYAGTDKMFVAGEKRLSGEQGAEGDAVNRAP